MLAHDLTGKRFGRLLVKSRTENQGISVRFLCKCDCGTWRKVTAANLKKGSTRSCGCYRRELSSRRCKETPPRKGKKRRVAFGA